MRSAAQLTQSLPGRGAFVLRALRRHWLRASACLAAALALGAA